MDTGYVEATADLRTHDNRSAGEERTEYVESFQRTRGGAHLDSTGFLI